MKTPVFTDIIRNVWIVNNPSKQSQSVEFRPYSIPLLDGERRYMVEWRDAWAK